MFNFNEDKPINVPLTENRAFLYGDGFFETIIIKEGQLISFHDHYQRMNYAARQLHLFPFPLLEQLKKKIDLLIGDTNGLFRLKIIVFRNSEGLYAPNKNTPLFYFEKKEVQKSFPIQKTAFFSKTVTNKVSLTSKFKTLSSLHYVLAGVELKNTTFDEVILLDEKENISESLSSNIWWIKDRYIFTPSTSTGCIEGVARRKIIRYLTTNKIEFKEGEFKKENITDADFCFTSNVAGLHIIKSLEGSNYTESHKIFIDLVQHLN